MSRTNPNIEVTLLSKEEVEGKSKVLQKVGIGCNQPYWTSTPTPLYFDYWGNANEFSVDDSGALGWDGVDIYYFYGVRPVLKADNLEELIKNCKIDIKDGVQTVEYGEYPHLFEETDIYNLSHLRETGKTYSLTPQVSYTSLYDLDEYPPLFIVDEYLEYYYNDQKVIEIDYTYYPVKPVKFYVDRENNMLISTNVLFKSPINMDDVNYNGNFKTSQLYNFLNNEFIKDLMPNEKEKYSYYDSNLIERIEKLIRINEELLDINEELQAKSEAISRELEELKTTAQGRQYVKKIK